MRKATMISLCASVAALVAAPLGALAQNAPELKPAQTETKAIGVPSTATITSVDGWSPAASAGPPGATAATRTP